MSHWCMKCEIPLTPNAETFSCPTCNEGFIIPLEQHSMDVDEQQLFPQANTTSQNTNSGGQSFAPRQSSTGRSSNRRNRNAGFQRRSSRGFQSGNPFGGIMQLIDQQLGQGQGSNPIEIFNQIIPPGLTTTSGNSTNNVGGGLESILDEISQQLSNPRPARNSAQQNNPPTSTQNTSQQGESTQNATPPPGMGPGIRVFTSSVGSNSGNNRSRGDLPTPPRDGPPNGDFFMDLIGRIIGDNGHGSPFANLGGGNIEFVIDNGMDFPNGGIFGRNFGDFVSDGDLGTIEDWLYRNFGNIQGPAPATEESIREIPQTKITQQHVDEELQCSVCFENFNLDEQVKKLPCNHMYHPQCIDQWLVHHNTCPICREPAAQDAQRSSNSRTSTRENSPTQENQSGGTTSNPTPRGTSLSFRIHRTPTRSSLSNNQQSPGNQAENSPSNQNTPTASSGGNQAESAPDNRNASPSNEQQTQPQQQANNNTNRIRDFFGTFMPFFGNVPRHQENEDDVDQLD